MSAKDMLKPASRLLIAEFAKRGVALKPTISYQLLAAAYGFWSHESVAQYGIPFEPFNEQHSYGAKPHFQLGMLKDRISSLLGVDAEESQFLTLLVRDLMTHHYPLRVQALRILFDDAFTHSRETIFKILSAEGSGQTSLASAEIMAKRLPELPATTLAGHLKLMRNQLIDVGPGVRTVDEFISSAPTWIWCYPSAFMNEAIPSLADVGFHTWQPSDDWVPGGVNPRTEIGVGFVLLQLRGDSGSQNSYTVVSGVYSLNSKASNPTWSDIKAVGDIRREVSGFRKRTLSELLGHPVDRLPLLKCCAECGDLYAAGATALIRCSCPKG
ncbi:hypothetical protein [Pseudomonas mosselii]|uniref:hypothetical protein n=1 Tax=Pseudomonas mosselii TaxID=78327 RepID=UPI0021D940BE|nr:hypothetical protein [Pseudomonas mosselii]MCU9527505.1 hypothetical protein [Pseudomonas mosselii]MCU9534818.1 hypothetical protein [Pseudomonas mosselii]MCU9542752.1 hypothetical protein [Pseudomonas mosselii]MCU9546658.1 hypothetical protein [Pseudomonas mosselii]